jgi:hypothetical protein
VSGIPVAHGPETRFGFVCLGSLWGIAGLGILLNGFGLIASKTVPLFFLAGFVVAFTGVLSSFIIFNFSKRAKIQEENCHLAMHHITHLPATTQTSIK